MSKKKGNKDRLVVYSTNPDFSPLEDISNEEDEMKPSELKLYVFIDRKQRRGKEMTCVEGFRGPGDQREQLGRELKTACGAGGSVKDGVIYVQGNHVEKIAQMLKEKGFSQTKIKGGY